MSTADLPFCKRCQDQHGGCVYCMEEAAERALLACAKAQRDQGSAATARAIPLSKGNDMNDEDGQGAPFCRFCQDKPGGCLACTGQDAERARIEAQRAQERARVQEARECLRALLNPKRSQGAFFATETKPSNEAIALVAQAFDWLRRQDAERMPASCAPQENEDATALRFGAIEWAESQRSPRPDPPIPTRVPIEVDR